ncbi:hypothetical protein NMG60_11023664 [Bertholletia excelsa]
MEGVMGLLKIKVKRGINLVVKDTRSSDPYVVIQAGNEKLKTKVIKKNCNPLWNEELTLSIKDPKVPILLTVYDKDRFSEDDKMGDAEIDIGPYIECLKMGLGALPTGTKVDRVQPNKKNCLADQSEIIWDNGKMYQEMSLRLRNVKHGEVQIQIQWTDLPGCKMS